MGARLLALGLPLPADRPMVKAAKGLPRSAGEPTDEAMLDWALSECDRRWGAARAQGKGVC